MSARLPLSGHAHYAARSNRARWFSGYLKSGAPRCLKDVVEERLFAHRRDLFTQLDLVFMDTTSLYFEGAGGPTLGRHGYSKDHRPDLRQMILAVLIDGDGQPVCSEMWPGNTADVTTLIPVIERLRRRFRHLRACAWSPTAA